MEHSTTLDELLDVLKRNPRSSSTTHREEHVDARPRPDGLQEVSRETVSPLRPRSSSKNSISAWHGLARSRNSRPSFQPNSPSPIPADDVLTEGLLSRGDLGIIVGLPGAAKTFLAVDWAVALCNARDDWFGHRCLIS